MSDRIYGISEAMIQARRFQNFLLTYVFIAFAISMTMLNLPSMILEMCITFASLWLILYWYGPEFRFKFGFKTNDFAAWVAWQMERLEGVLRQLEDRRVRNEKSDENYKSVTTKYPDLIVTQHPDGSIDVIGENVTVRNVTARGSITVEARRIK